MTDLNKDQSNRRYSIIEIAIGYLIIQAFLLLIISRLPWPVVGYETWGGHSRGRVTPEPVWALFWVQLAVGAFLPIRGKAFLLAQYLVFALAFLLLAEVEGIERYGNAVISSTTYAVYWFQFGATALALIARRYRKSKARPWYPLAAYLGIQLAIVWGISDIRLSLGWDLGKWLLLAFVIQCVGLLLVPVRIRILVAAEILLGVMLANLPRWVPASWNDPPSLVFDGLWVAYLLQCVWLAWWLKSLPKKASLEANKLAHSISTDDRSGRTGSNDVSR
jgi:hypothetical protein